MFKKYLIDTILAIIAVFAPIKALMIVVILLVFADLISGILAARKQGKLITSSGLSRSVSKVLIYEAVICMSYLVETYITGSFLPVGRIVAALVSCVELKSLLENSEILLGAPIFQVLVDKLTKESTPKSSNHVDDDAPPIA